MEVVVERLDIKKLVFEKLALDGGVGARRLLENPFGSNFDTTFVYGPIFGSIYYTGLRYKLN